MKKFICKLLEYLFLFIFGGTVYVEIEFLYRCHSHWTMFILGGICFITLGLINEIFPKKTSFLLQCIMGGIDITILEFITGYIVNLQLGWNVWDYSNLPLNVMGQVCIPFTLLWILISGVAIVVDDILRWKIFKEDRPQYKIV